MYQLKVLIVILALTVGGLWISRKAFSPSIFNADEFRQIGKLIIYITLAAFLSNSYLLYTVICVWVLRRHKGDLPPTALFLALMFLVPAFDYTMSGFGPIKSLLSWNHLRLLSLFLLLPWLWQKDEQAKLKPSALANLALWCLILPLLIQTYSLLQEDTPMNAVRAAIYYLTDTLVPFLVFSRFIRNVRTLQMTLAGYCISVTIIGLMGTFEFSNKWLIYDQLDDWLGTPIISRYLMRGETGWLRAFASTGHSLIMGCVCAAGFLLGLGVAPSEKEASSARHGWRACMALMFIGLFSSLARGSWVGVAAGLAAWVLTGPKPGKGMLIATVVTALSLGALLLSPFGEKVIQTLPFVGDSDQGNVNYRKQLLETSWIVIQDNFWMGSPYFMFNPLMETLKQGQGIIDVVNVYLSYWLSAGLIGLVLFAIPLVLPWLALLGSLFQTRSTLGDTDAHRMGRAVLAAMLAIMVIIATTSSIMAIPWLYTIAGGLCLCTRSILLAKPAAAVAAATRSKP